MTSANRDAIQPTLERFKTPLFYATDYEGGVCSRYIICYSALAGALGRRRSSRTSSKTTATASTCSAATTSGRSKMNEAVSRGSGEVGGKVVGEEYTPFGVKDFTSTVRKIEQSGAKVLVLDVVGADAITFVKQFAAAGRQEQDASWPGSATARTISPGCRRRSPKAS